MITDKQVEAAGSVVFAVTIGPVSEYLGAKGTKRRESFDALIRRALEAAEAAAWEPIETAPKDGPRILVEGPHSRGGTYIETTDYWGGKWSIEWMDGYGAPTRWRPLPAPPKEPTL